MTDLRQIRNDLVEIAQLCLLSRPDILRWDDQLYLGLYRQYGSQRKTAEGITYFAPDPQTFYGSDKPPDKMPPEEKKRWEKDLGFKVQFRLLYDQRHRLKLVNRKEPYRFDASSINLPDESDVDVDAAFGREGFLYLNVRADLVHDNQAEMEAALIPSDVASFIFNMGDRDRKTNFGTSLGKALPVGTEFYTDYGPIGFKELLLSRATYKISDSAPYYKKWRNGAKPRRREFAYNYLSNEYLKENYHEKTLRKGFFYLLLMDQYEKVLLQLSKSSSGTDDPVHITPVYTTSHLFAQTRKAAQTIAAGRRRAVFFYSIDGADPPKSNPPDIELKVSYNELLVNPKQMVMKAWEIDRDSNLPSEVRNWDEKYWFREMVRLYFPAKLYPLYRGSFGTNIPFDREQMLINSLPDHPEDNAIGPLRGNIKASLDKLLDDLKKDENLVYLAQGGAVSKNKRFVGVDPPGWVYMRNTRTGLTTKVSPSIFLINLDLRVFLLDLYERTKVLIPFIQVVTWGALAVGTGGVIGFQALASTVRSYVRSELRASVKGAIRDQFRKLMPQIVGLVIYGFLSILPFDEEDRSYRLTRGFLRGATLHAFERLYKRILSRSTRFLRILRAAELVKRLTATVYKIAKKIEELKDKISAHTAKVLVMQLGDILYYLRRGSLLLFSALLFLDYDRNVGNLKVSDYLEIVAEISGTKKISKTQWNTMRQKHFKKVLYLVHIHYRAEIAEYASDKIDSEVQKWYATNGQSVLAAATFTAESSIIEDFSGITPAYLFIAAALFLSGYQAAQESRNWLEIAFKVLTKPITNFEDYTPDEAEKLGELLGDLVGTFFLNHSLFGRNAPLGKLAKRSKFGKLIEKHLRLGLILPTIRLLLAHYIILFERYQKMAKGLLKDLRKFIYDLDSMEEIDEFLTDDERQLSFRDVKVRLSNLDTILFQALRKLVNEENIGETLLKMAQSLEKTRFPTLKELVDGKLPEGWTVEATSFILLSYLRCALYDLGRVVQLIEKPVTAVGTGSWLEVLHIIGFELGDKEANDTLAEDVDQIFAL